MSPRAAPVRLMLQFGSPEKRKQKRGGHGDGKVKHGASPGKRAAAEDDQEGHVHKKARHSASQAQQQGKKHKPGLSTAHGKPAQAHSQPAAAGPGKVQHTKPSSAAGGKLLQSVKAKHAFKVDDPRDHAETPFEAYRDIEPLLFRLAQQLGTPKESLRIYDPYFCAGSCVTHLSRLGFKDVYNRNEDFYAVAAAGRCPEFDVLVTNPPFSGDHMRRALEFAASCGKPWALLMPDFVAKKSYFSEVLRLGAAAAVLEQPPAAASANSKGKGKPKAPAAASDVPETASPATPDPLQGARTSASSGPLYYLGPTKAPYKFSVPADDGGSGDGERHTFTPASFQCVWFLALGSSHTPALVKWWGRKQGGGSGASANAPGSASMLAADAQLLPQLAMDRSKKRREEDAAKRPWRKKLLRMRKKAAKAAAGSL